MEVVTGVLYHAVGASSAALCYTPQKKVSGWAWQTYWLAQAFVCWLVLPLVVAWLTIPQLATVLREAPAAAMWSTFLLGAAYGVGGTAFGMAIRYVGFSLTYALAVGISCVLGTLLPPLVRNELGVLFHQRGAGWIMAGIALGAMGIALCGIAGRFKEKDMAGNNNSQVFSLSKGLPLCFLAGILSAVYGFALDQGQPIAAVAEKYGSGNFQGNVVYIFANTGAFLTTAVYCLYLHAKEGTWSEYRNARPGLNFGMAILTGLLWYGQFLFYGLGHVRMGNYKFSSWAIHMIMLVLFSSVAGLLLKEWVPARSRTRWILALALGILTLAVLILTYGNYLG